MRSPRASCHCWRRATSVPRSSRKWRCLGEHQCVYALHRNTDNYHLHLAVNRVHPDTERVLTVNGGFDIEVAHRAIARIEHDQGWEREARGRYLVLDDRELRRAPAPTLEPHQRQPTTRGRDLENQIGEKSAQRLAIERGAEALRRARHWQELHLLLAERDMHFERKGSGAVLWIGDVAVKASIAGRDCSLSALEKRLGEFVPARERAPVRQLAPEPVEPAAKGWKTYSQERQTHYAEKTQQREQLREQHRNRWQEMIERHREERRAGLTRDWRGQGARLNGLRSMLAARQAQEKAQARERQELERERLREQFPRWPTFEEWLRERGNRDLADEWRFRDRTPASIVGDREDLARPRDIRAFTPEVRGWEVHYGRADEPRSGTSFVDRGREIRIHDLRRESVLAALQLSAQKWRTFQVFGSDQYKRLCVDLAIEHGFRITNPELQQTIADERAARRVALDRAGRAPPPRREPVHDIGEAYRRHLEDVREVPRYRDADAARLDATVAVRLRATGYGRDDIERTIREEAAKGRPRELRDWTEYAKRMADRAFGLPGRRELDAFARTRDRLLALEGRTRERERSLDLARRRGPEIGR